MRYAQAEKSRRRGRPAAKVSLVGVQAPHAVDVVHTREVYVLESTRRLKNYLDLSSGRASGPNDQPTPAAGPYCAMASAASPLGGKQVADRNETRKRPTWSAKAIWSICMVPAA